MLSYREIFCAHNGPPPWTCNYCGEFIHTFGRRRDEGHVHHLDNDHANDVPSNLVVVHVKCHSMIHRTGTTFHMPDAAKIKISRARSGVQKSPDHRRKIAASLRGRALRDRKSVV